MRVIDAGAKKHIQDAGQHRIADITVLPGHGTVRDSALESRPHAQTCAVDQLANHRNAVRKIIAAVGIAHQQISPERAVTSADQRRAIAPHWYIDDARAEFSRQRLAAIGRTIVSNDNLAG
ncbi:MAG TPA: hypothetical protein VMF67_12160 [Rhizomicrobium sp.]|nr:hypothetical protein [Rhizomicrobium sp.]